LEDVVVLDLTRALAGPHATMMLGDLGARVIKVESPAGDDTRDWGPPFVDGAGARMSTYFMSCNRNKESLCLDLRTEQDREVLRRLIRQADVLAENFRPGVLDRLGFPAEVIEALNPRLVMLSISGFGHDGPEAGRAGYDQIAQGEAGLMSLTGPDAGTPTKVGVPIADLLAGIYGAYGVVSALHERERTGRGTVVRTSLLAAMVGVHSFQGTRATAAGMVPTAVGNQHPSIAPYGSFQCADAAVQLAVGSQGLWRAFAPLVGLDPDDERFASNADRVTRREELAAIVDGVFGERTADEVLADLSAAGVPAGRIRTLDEVYAWEQTLSQGLLVEVEHAQLGRLRLPGPPLRFAGHDGVERTGTEHRPPPVLDEHRTGILDWLAACDEAVAAFPAPGPPVRTDLP
jgi:crotonobetainyl-CoA:carnitine CoA-transferase CaiB-like acyl-CoA transferase